MRIGIIDLHVMLHIFTLCSGAASAYGIGFSRVNWSHWGELALGSLSALSSAALLVMVFISNIWVCYGGYIVFKSLYMLLITIAM